MTQLYQERNNYITFIYTALRMLLGFYLIAHAFLNLYEFEAFMEVAQSYIPADSALGFAAYLTPVVPLMEFFLGLLIFIGLYSRISLKWAIGIGAFFTLVFHITGDYETALIHSYTVFFKLILVYWLYYNKISLDYYNLFTEARRAQREEHNTTQKLTLK